MTEFHGFKRKGLPSDDSQVCLLLGYFRDKSIQDNQGFSEESLFYDFPI